MRVLIVDDEAPARARLRQILAAHASLEVVGEAETGVQAMDLAMQLTPDVMLPDIQMPGCSGIDVAACWRGRTQWEELYWLTLVVYKCKLFNSIGTCSGL